MSAQYQQGQSAGKALPNADHQRHVMHPCLYGSHPDGFLKMQYAPMILHKDGVHAQAAGYNIQLFRSDD